MTTRLTAWLRKHRRRAMVRRIAETWGKRDALLELEILLRKQLCEYDEANAPAWTPTTEYKGGELVRMPDGAVVRVAGPDSPQFRNAERIARSRREAYGHEAPLEVEQYPRLRDAGAVFIFLACLVAAAAYHFGVFS